MSIENAAAAASHRFNKSGFRTLLSVFILTGCATTPPPVAPLSEPEIRLTAAAARVAESLAQLATIEQHARQIHVQALTPAILPLELRVRVNVEYQGDLKPLVDQLARTAGYQMQTYGRATTLVPVTLVAENRAIGEILADIGYQTSAYCDVVVIPEQQLVEIRYRRSLPSRTTRRDRQG